MTNGRFGPPRAGARAGGEVERRPGDEESGIEPGGVEDHREHRGRRGLAVGAGHRDHMPVRKHVLGQPRGTGGISQPPVENVLHARIAASHRVADHHDVGRG